MRHELQVAGQGRCALTRGRRRRAKIGYHGSFACSRGVLLVTQRRLTIALRRAAAALIALLVCGLPVAAAQDYPNRPITLIVPYPPGGGVDTMGRLMGQKLSVALGQQVIIENRGGAGGMLGTRTAVKAAPDGYTLVMTLTGLSLGPNPGYDFRKDLARS